MARNSLLSPWPREALEFTNALERAGRALRVARRGLSGAYGLTVAEWRMLRALRPPRNSTGPSAGVGVGRERNVAALARRLRLASLTPDGERSLQRLESTMRTLLLEMTNSISPYWLEPLTEALTRLSDRLRSCPSVLRASRLGRRAGGRPRKIRQPG